MQKLPLRQFVVVAALGLLAACARAGNAIESRQVRFDGSDFRVVDIDLARDTLELHWRDTSGNALGSIDALSEWGVSQPNGIFYLDQRGNAGVVTTERWRKLAIDARLATQSGPMLVVDGAINAKFDAQSDSLKWRSGVCAKTPQRVAFAVSTSPVTFHAFARVFRDELDCRDALYLDGTLSQIYVRGQGFAGAPALMLKPYAGIFAVFTDSPRAR